MSDNPDRTALILWGVDRNQLRRARTMLDTLLAEAPPGESHNRLEFIVDQVDALDRFISGRRINVPDEVLEEMMTSGADNWVAAILGWKRDEVRYLRTKWRVPALKRGGNVRDRRQRWTTWLREWKKRLQELDLWPS